MCYTKRRSFGRFSTRTLKQEDGIRTFQTEGLFKKTGAEDGVSWTALGFLCRFNILKKKKQGGGGYFETNYSVAIALSVHEYWEFIYFQEVVPLWFLFTFLFIFSCCFLFLGPWYGTKLLKDIPKGFQIWSSWLLTNIWSWLRNNLFTGLLYKD